MSNQKITKIDITPISVYLTKIQSTVGPIETSVISVTITAYYAAGRGME